MKQGYDVENINRWDAGVRNRAKLRGESDSEILSECASNYYFNTDPLCLYEKNGKYYLRGVHDCDFDTFKELQEFLEEMNDTSDIPFCELIFSEIEERDFNISDLSDKELIHLIDEFPDYSFLADYDVETELEYRTDIMRYNYINDSDFDFERFNNDFEENGNFDSIENYYRFYYADNFSDFIKEYVGRDYNIDYAFDKFIDDAVEKLGGY